MACDVLDRHTHLRLGLTRAPYCAPIRTCAWPPVARPSCLLELVAFRAQDEVRPEGDVLETRLGGLQRRHIELVSDVVD